MLVLLGCGLLELAIRTVDGPDAPLLGISAIPPLVAMTGGGSLLALTWVAFKVGALSYGGGFVIVPLMHDDAVRRHHWLTDPQFLNAVALGQITPGPVTHTVAAVGYAAAGVGGGLQAALVAFAPSFALVLAGAGHFQQLRQSRIAQSFLDGAGPVAVGAIVGAAIPLASAIVELWQWWVLAGAAILLFPLRRGVVSTLLLSGASVSSSRRSQRAALSSNRDPSSAASTVAP